MRPNTPIHYEASKTGTRIYLPLCPSTNARMIPIRMGYQCREILTSDARNYIHSIGTELKIMMRQQKISAIDRFAYVDLWFILPRTNCDAHNYGKVLFDAMQTGGLFTNDKFILPRIMGVGYKSPGEIIADVPIKFS